MRANYNCKPLRFARRAGGAVSARPPHSSALQTPSPKGEGKGRARTRNFLLKSRNFVAPLREKIRELLFEYRAFYVVHVFGDAVVHAHQLHDFVARVDDGGVIAPAHDLADGDEGKRKHIAH